MFRRAILGMCVLTLFSSGAVCACTCAKDAPGACRGLQNDDIAFLGTVTDIGPAEALPPAAPSDASAAPTFRYHFHVDENFSGAAAEMDIFSGGDDGDCAYRFRKGEQYVVFPHASADGRLFATICSGTRTARDARALLPQLRAMRNGQRVASVFGVIRRTDPPTLAPSDDPDDPLSNLSLKLRSRFDRFSTATDADGVYSFYDVHAGEYRLTANVPPRTELTQRTLPGPLPAFQIPAGACYEFNVDVLPTGHIRGSVLGSDGKPVSVASVELYRAGRYEHSRAGLWRFQGSKGVFDFDHLGPGEYLLVYNRPNRRDPNSPYPRTFYPGTRDESEAALIRLADGQQLLNANIRLKDALPTHHLRVTLKWKGARPPGEVFVAANADDGMNPAAHKISDTVYDFTVLDGAHYTVSAFEELDPRRILRRPRSRPLKPRAGANAGHTPDGDSLHSSDLDDCAAPARIETDTVAVNVSGPAAKELVLAFAPSECKTTSQLDHRILGQ